MTSAPFVRRRWHGSKAILALAVIVLLPARVALAVPVTAVAAHDFLDSIGIVSTFPDRGQSLGQTIQMIRYCGFRWVRAAVEGLTDTGPTTMRTYADLHRQTGVRFSWGLGSGGSDVGKLIETGKQLAAEGALLAFEGSNEPNNWSITFQGKVGGGRTAPWLPVAQLQHELYRAVKGDAQLQAYPVWSMSETGAEAENVGLQFLTIPADAGGSMPDGTKFADYANVHNYVYHPHSPYPTDNKTWNAADPTSASRVDGLYGNFGRTWHKGFRGYPDAEILALPRVTTETGLNIEGDVTEEMHGRNMLTLYLDQFVRGYSYTSVYLLRDRTDEAGNQSFGFYRPDYTPRKAATYLHNLTTILADTGTPGKAGQLDFDIPDQPDTVHQLLLRKADGNFDLVIWNERLSGSDTVKVKFGSTLKSIVKYDPVVGTEPMQSSENIDSLDVSISDHPIILRIAAPKI